MIEGAIFKKYDIRGRFPEEIDERVIRKLVKAYIKVFSPAEVVIGHDPLEGSKKMYPHICDEFSQLGVLVNQLGMVSTPMLYYASAYYRISHGIMLTASHLGVGHTGMKIVIDGMPPSPDQIKKMSRVIKLVGEKDTYPGRAKVRNLDILVRDYTDYICRLIVIDKPLHEYKVVVDSSNGPNGNLIKNLFDKFSIENIVINREIRARDLAHGTNPKIKENREQLADEVVNSGSDLGVIWDGDGDRAYFLDWEGNIIPPEFVGIKIGSYLASRKGGSKITVDVRASNAVERELKKEGVRVMRIEAWHVPIKYKMPRDEEIMFGMETSGHYVFRDFYRIDDGLLASLMFLAAIETSAQDYKKELSKFRKRYKIVEEINFYTSKTEEELIKELSAVYKAGKINLLDGLTVEFSNWRFNLRASKTEPIIRLNISGTSSGEVDKNLGIIESYLGG